MNETERQALLQAITQRQEQVDEDALFDALDNVRIALSSWDLQGPIPYAQELQAWGLLPQESPVPAEGASEETIIPSGAAALPPDEAAMQDILAELRRLISASAPGSTEHTGLREMREALRRWRETRAGPLPCADELARLGIWPSPPHTEPTTMSPLPDPDDDLQSEFEAAKSIMAQYPYQAIKQLEDLQKRVRGKLVEPLKIELDKARTQLTRHTNDLVDQARVVAMQRPHDLEAQAAAWRAVTALNPDSWEAQDALGKLQLRVQEDIAAELAEIERQAQDAAKRKHLPDLNGCLGKAEALYQRGDLPADLKARAKAVMETVEKQRQQVRDELGVASTKKVQGELKEAYQMALKYLEDGIPVIPDTAGVLGIIGADVETKKFFDLVSGDYLNATRQKVSERLASVRMIQRQSPDQALAYLEEAKGWLTDNVWTPDHKGSLSPQLEEVEREIQDVKRLQVAFNQAREKVIAAQQPGVSARERLRLLVEVQETYRDYPSIAKYIEEARDNLAEQLVPNVDAAIEQAHLQMGGNRFDQARDTLQKAHEAVLRDIPQPKADSRLAQALARLKQEEEAIGQAELAFQRLQQLLELVEAKLSAYDADKNLGLLNEARALLKEVPDAQRDHPQVKKVRSQLAALQGDAENYDAGRRAYERREWAAARDYFDKVSPAFEQKAQADRLRGRAQAVLDIEAAQKAEKDKKWGDALNSYRAAAYLLKENGEDELTGGLLKEVQEALARLAPIEKNDREIEQALAIARERLTEAQKRVAQREKQSLRERLSSLPELISIIVTLEAKASMLSTRGDEIDDVLGQARQMWRGALFPALRQVIENLNAEEILLQAAHQRAQELKAAGLLYADQPNDNVEKLYYELEARQLDKTYEQLKKLPLPHWAADEQGRRRQNDPSNRLNLQWLAAVYGIEQAHQGQDAPSNVYPPTELGRLTAIEDNRRARWNLPLVQKDEKLREQWIEARRACIEHELRQIEEEKGGKAAFDLVTENVRTGRWPAEPWLLEAWLDLCWRAKDWKTADDAAQRFADADIADRAIQVKIWQELNRVARSLADGDLQTALTQLEALRTNYSDEELFDRVEEKLKGRALKDLLDAANAERRELEKLIAQARVEKRGLEKGAESAYADRIFVMAQKYKQVRLLDENNREAQEGLQWAGEYIKPLIAQRCKEAVALKVSRGEREHIEKARDEAVRLLTELRVIEDVAPYLTLPDETKEQLSTARKQVQAKKEWWDTVINRHAEFEREVQDALSLPTALDEQDPERGGWDFSEVRRLLNTLKNDALHFDKRDTEILSLIDGGLRRIEAYEATANELLALARRLLTAVREEQFEAVIRCAKELEAKWRDVKAEEPAWDGLEIVIGYTYPLPTPQPAKSPRAHLERALKQQENARQWEAYAQQVNSLYNELVKLERELLEGELKQLKERFSLKELTDKCDAWLKACEKFLQKLEDDLAQPESRRAESLQASIRHEERKNYLLGGEGTRNRIEALKGAIQQAQKDLEPWLGRFRNFYNGLPERIKSGKASPSAEQQNTAARAYRECCKYDPLNKEVLDLKKRLEGLGFTLKE